jgi:hypothetical protein
MSTAPNPILDLLRARGSTVSIPEGKLADNLHLCCRISILSSSFGWLGRPARTGVKKTRTCSKQPC